MKLLNYFDEFYRRERLIGRSAQTVRTYLSQLASLEELAGRELDISEVDSRVVGDAIDELVRSGAAIATANKLLRHIKAVWKHAIEAGQNDNVCRLRQIKEPRRIPRVFTLEEFEAILDVARRLPASADVIGKRSLPAEVNDVAACLWWEALLLLAYFSGLRVSALLSIRWQDLDVERCELLVRAETQKQKSDQLFTLPREMIDSIERLRPRRRRTLVFDWPLDRNKAGKPSGEWKALRRHLKRITAAAGVPQGAKHMFHGLRRLTATQATAAGGINAAKQLLDHSSEHVTRRYVDPRQAPDRIDAAKLLPMPGKPKLRIVREGEAG